MTFLGDGAYPLSKSRCVKRAMSLPEVVFSVGLASLLLLIAFRMATQFLRLYRLESTKTDMQQSVLISLSRLATDCSLTVPNGISIKESSPVTVAFNPYVIRPDGSVIDGSGLVSWDDRFIVYTWHPTSGDFLRFEHRPGVAPYTTPVRAKKLPPNLLQDIVLNHLPPKPQRLAREVSLFQIQPAGCETLVRQPLKFTLEVRRQKLSYRLSRAVFLAGSR